MQQQSQLKDYFSPLPQNVPLPPPIRHPLALQPMRVVPPVKRLVGRPQKVPAPQSLPTTHADTDTDTDTDTEQPPHKKKDTGYLHHKKETGSGELC